MFVIVRGRPLTLTPPKEGLLNIILTLGLPMLILRSGLPSLILTLGSLPTRVGGFLSLLRACPEQILCWKLALITTQAIHLVGS